MIKLARTLAAWNTANFKDTLKGEIEQLAAEVLPLQQGLSQSSYVSNDNITAMILTVTEEPGLIRIKTGIFYSGLIPGCNCADDPTPEEKYTEHCELQFDIDKITAETTITFLA